MKQCRICSSKINKYMEIDNVPLQVSKLFDKPEQQMQKYKFIMYKCPNCNLYQIEYINGNYYDDYIMQVSYSKQMELLQNEELSFICNIANEKRNFLEIGCGNGSFLKEAEQHFQKCVGFEPSKIFYEQCLEKKLNVVNEYFPSNKVNNIKFDAFASRQVFEHIPNPLKTLKAIYESLNYGGVGLIEVPNGRQIINKSRYHEIISDHINYYTEKSLIELCTRSNFEIVKLSEAFNGDYLQVYVRKIKKNLDIITTKESDEKLLKKCLDFDKVIVWGAGAKAFNFMNLIKNTNNIIAYIDGDKYKENKYLPNAKLPISKPNKIILEANIIIIFSITYEHEIIQILKDFGYQGQICSLLTKEIKNIHEF